MANEAATICSISYIGQAHPFDILSVSTWSEPSNAYKMYGNAPGRNFRVDFMKGSKIITRMSITVFDVSEKAASTAAHGVAAAAL